MNLTPFPSRPSISLVLAAAGLLIPPANAAVVSLSESTLPPGIFSSSGNVETGTTVSTRAAGNYDNNVFTHWTLNGVRNTDPSGRSRNPLSFVILEPTNAVANYLPSGQDSDSDGIADSLEVEFYGSLAETAASDTDGDGIPMAKEFLRSLSPRVADQFAEGGISRRRGAKIEMAAAGDFLLTETSDPLGIINTTRTIPGGSQVALSIAAQYSGSRIFTGWYTGGTRIDSPLAPQPVTFNMAADTTASAKYTESAADSDGDGIPDWYELFYHGDLSLDGSGDADGDGFTSAQERARGQIPLVDDELVEGGISRRRSGIATIAPVAYVNCTINSVPFGLVNQTVSAASGSEVVTQDFAGVYFGGDLFAGWEVNGVRETDPSGSSTGIARFTASAGATATARFISPSLDADGDGVSDWFEYFHLGGYGSGPAADGDGDGYSLAVEAARGHSPLTVDNLAEGGISRRRSAMAGVNLQPFERLDDVPVDGVLTPFFTADPSISPPSGLDFGDHASPALCDWDGDGDADLFIASNGAMAVYENIGTRFKMDLSERTTTFGGLAGLCSGVTQPVLAAGDWSGDGKQDLMLADGSGTLHLIQSNGSFAGSGLGTASGTFTPTGSGVLPALGDLDGNGKPDLLLASTGGVIEYYPHSGNAAAPYAGPAAISLADTLVTGISSLAIADISLDGLNDVLAADADGRIWEFHAVAGGGYHLSSKVWGGSGAGFTFAPRIAAFDFEGDGDIDLAGGTPDGGVFGLRDPHVGRPTGLVATSGADNVLLEWTPDWQSRIVGYNVYRGTAPGEEKLRINPDQVLVAQYLDEALQPVPTHYYQVTGLSRAIFAGNSEPTVLESPRSATVASASRQLVLDLQEVKDYAGAVASVPLSIGNSVGLAGNGMDLRIGYPAGLEPTAHPFGGGAIVEPSGLAANLVFTTSVDSVNRQLRIQGTGGTVAPGQGKLFTLNFRIANGTATGTILPLTLPTAILKDENGATVPAIKTGGSVEVVARPGQPPASGGVEVGIYGLGDLTGDGYANQLDLDLLRQLIRPFGPTPVITPQQLAAGDINGDDKLSHQDLPGLIRITLGLQP